MDDRKYLIKRGWTQRAEPQDGEYGPYVDPVYPSQSAYTGAAVAIQLERDASRLDAVEGELAAVKGERAAWQQTAEQFARNEKYYKSLVVTIGQTLGPSAYISDDGSVQEDVICAKVPEIVAALARQDFELLQKAYQRTEEERAMLFEEQTAAYAAFGYEDYEGENSVADMILNQQSAQAEGLIELLNKVNDQNAKLEAQVTALTAQAERQRVALERLLTACTTDCGMLEKAGAVEEARAALTGQGDGE